MSTREGDNFLVRKTHARAKQGAEVRGTLQRVGQATIGGAATPVGVIGATQFDGYMGTAHEFNGHGTGNGKQIGVRHLGVVDLDWVQQLTNDQQTSVGPGDLVENKKKSKTEVNGYEIKGTDPSVDSGSNRIVAPLEPPVPSARSNVPEKLIIDASNDIWGKGAQQ